MEEIEEKEELEEKEEECGNFLQLHLQSVPLVTENQGHHEVWTNLKVYHKMIYKSYNDVNKPQ